MPGLTLSARARAVIPSSAQTYSKSPSRWPNNAPRFLMKAEGAYVWDIDGRKYLDYDAALGPVILGHNHPKVNTAIGLAMQHGISFPLPTYPEVKLAELLVETIPCAEMVRFGKNGADATAAAVRLARAYTGRDVIVRFKGSYHGYHDWSLARTGPPPGYSDPPGVFCPTVDYEPAVWLQDYDDFGAASEAVALYGDGNLATELRAACIIVEPIRANNPTLPTMFDLEADEGDDPFDEYGMNFLEALRFYCDKTGTILIFDEVFTGFRFPELSAQAHFGVTPDLACFSKAMANGMPISAVVGRRDIMKLLDEGVFYSTTFAGETLSIAAAIATIEELKTGEPLKRIWEHGAQLSARFTCYRNRNDLAEHLEVLGWPARIVLKWREPELGRIFNAEMIEQGVLFNGYANVMAAHGQDELYVAEEAIIKAFDKVSAAIAEGVTA